MYKNCLYAYIYLIRFEPEEIASTAQRKSTYESNCCRFFRKAIKKFKKIYLIKIYLHMTVSDNFIHTFEFYYAVPISVC